MQSVKVREAGTSSERGGAQPLTARMEPFDSFWEGPEDIEKGYRTLFEFYRHNYLAQLPADRDAEILVVSCGPGYFVDMLVRHGYRRVTGIDSDPSKVEHARKRGLACHAESLLPFLEHQEATFDAIVCEQELNHLTKSEMIGVLEMCRGCLSPGGRIVVHGLNGANPITGPEALAQNLDHYNTFTEYSLRQVLELSGYRDVGVFPLKLYVFYSNPLNYVGLALTAVLEATFRVLFGLYGKTNRIFSKKIGAVATR